jgi:hypothetical protein
MFASLFKRQYSLKMVKLKNDSEAPESAVVTTMRNLDFLMKKNPIAFYELVQKCRNPKHDMLENTNAEVEKLALMQSGSIHEITKNIILSSVEGEGLGMTLKSPVERNNCNIRMTRE